MGKWVKVQEGIDMLCTERWRRRAFSVPQFSMEEDRERLACLVEVHHAVGRGLKNGTLKAAGIRPDGSWADIDPRMFEVGQIERAGRSHSLWSQNPKEPVRLFSDIVIDENSLELLTARDNRPSTARAETECLKWLSKQIRDNPQQRILKDELKKMADATWGKALSGRGFNNAFRTAKLGIESGVWRARGPLKKTK